MKSLEKKKSNSEFTVSLDIARILCKFSLNTGRQAAVILSRRGDTEYVLLGTPEGILIPVLSRFKLAPGRLRGLRVIHTHPAVKGLDKDDYADLLLLRLDSITSLNYDAGGEPRFMETAYILPGNNEVPYSYLKDRDPFNQRINYCEFIEALDEEILKKTKSLYSTDNKEYAVLTGYFSSREKAKEAMDELEELGRSAGVGIIAKMPQIKDKPHPKYAVGPGALKNIVIKALTTGAEYIIIDNELSPSQCKNISELTELKVIDRTQLILDIFAKRAKSDEGKLRVELAQLRYMLPRLTGRDDALSRLTGGIGGRGPGETKLEIDKRRISDRISFLKKRLKKLEESRKIQRVRRQKTGLPIVSLIGYTNAGKSTLLNKMTNSDVYADNLLFATLDTSTKRIRFPEERDVIVTDTVGFIKNLPPDLAGAFKSTLEELDEADLFLHVVDVSDDSFKEKINAVNNILEELNIIDKEKILVFNKTDLISDERLSQLENEYPEGVFISAINRGTFKTMLYKIQYYFFKEGIYWGNALTYNKDKNKDEEII